MGVVEKTLSYVIVPEVNPSPAIVLYGGLYGYEGAWFLKHIPGGMQQNVAFVLPKHYTNDCADCLKELHSAVPAEQISSYSLCGYSRGGVEVYRNRGLKEWKVFGLVDPTAPTMGGFDDDVLDNSVSKIRCVYWVPNWGKDGYGGKVPKFAQHLRDIKADMTEKAVEHKDMPDFFFKTYGNAWMP